MVRWIPLNPSQLRVLGKKTINNILNNETYAYIFNSRAYRVVKGKICMKELK